MTLEQSGFPPAGTVIPITGHDLVVEAGEHPFVAAHADAIRTHWTAEIAANPALYDGGLVLQRAVRLDGGCLSGFARHAPFSAMLYWRAHGRPPGATHLFALPVLVGSDDRIVAIRMGRQTANAGRIYCAAGSFDGNDIFEGRLDPNANMAREVGEETGIDLALADPDPTFHLMHRDNTIVLIRRYRFADPARMIAERIDSHVATLVAAGAAGDEEPEIDGAVVIGPDDADDPALAFFMPAILGWHFG